MPPSRRTGATPPIPCVLGNTDLVRALGLAGIRSAVVAPPRSPVASSRFAAGRIPRADNWGQPQRLLANLVRYGEHRPGTPLFFQHDGDLVFVSRHRDVLQRMFTFVLGDACLIERVVNKTRFVELASEAGLPTPPSVVLRPGAGGDPPEVPFDYPVVVKPVTRRDVVWKPIAHGAKAVELHSSGELDAIWPVLAASGVEFVLQELVPGREDHVESYHAYVDEGGEVVGEFTGRKLRTWPPAYGETTALEITDQGDVRELGRWCMRELGLRGVAKLDFKRAPDETLFLLEVNARFNLWHLPGAVAGTNLPALVYADLVGRRRPATGLHPGVRWSVPWFDLRAARAEGMSLAAWLRWQARCETRHILAVDEPMPFIQGLVWRRGRRALGSR